MKLFKPETWLNALCYFAVNKPIGWTINSVTFSSPEQGDGTLSYLVTKQMHDLAGAGIDVGWEDSVEAAHPATR